MVEGEAAVIAKGLSEAMVNLLFMWPKGLYDETTRKALARRGLIAGRTVTPLGIAVREHLTTPGAEG